MKKEVSTLNGTPHKRFILSIVSDYNLISSICELIDNAIDIWSKNNSSNNLLLNINFDDFQKSIVISDNAGGVKEKELEILISPGATSNRPDDLTIGIFGVGTKRAVIALSEDIKIMTRYRKNKSFLIEFDKLWLKDPNWELPYYEVDNIDENTTIIELNKLLVSIDKNEINNLIKKLSAIYGKFIETGKVEIRINSKKLTPVNYENWAYPPGYEPRKYNFQINLQNGSNVKTEVIAGLTMESSPTAGEYGVYFYCNDRLIVGALKTPEVGYIRGIAGLPDASLSIARLIVSFKGAAIDMPWNSSKTNINTNHYTFKEFRNWFFPVVKNYSSLSRRLKGTWTTSVFKYPKGKIINIYVPDIKSSLRNYLVELPKMNTRYIDELIQNNSNVGKIKPWTKGLYESMIIVDDITKQKKLETKNRNALILLDSNLEIAFKEFLVNDSNTYYSNDELHNLFKARHKVVKEIKKYFSEKDISDEDWSRINYYYNLRCKLVHEKATANILDKELDNMRKLVEKILKKLFKLRF